MNKIKNTIKISKIKDIEEKINKEIFCIAESILEIEATKIKGKIKGIIHKYIIKRFAQEKDFEDYALKLNMNIEIETEVKEAIFTLG